MSRLPGADPHQPHLPAVPLTPRFPVAARPASALTLPIASRPPCVLMVRLVAGQVEHGQSVLGRIAVAFTGRHSRASSLTHDWRFSSPRVRARIGSLPMIRQAGGKNLADRRHWELGGVAGHRRGTQFRGLVSRGTESGPGGGSASGASICLGSVMAHPALAGAEGAAPGPEGYALLHYRYTVERASRDYSNSRCWVEGLPDVGLVRGRSVPFSGGSFFRWTRK